MKKRIVLLITICIAVMFGFILNKKFLTYIYLNPYTNTKSFAYISRTIKELDKGFKYAQFSSAREGVKFDYLYFNVYGSGFIKNNSIPNDLDYAVGVHLGEYNYDGKNSGEIAANIVDKMNSFETTLNFYFNIGQRTNIYTTFTPFGLMGFLSKQREESIENIAGSLATALLPNNYVRYTQKSLEDTKESIKVDVPYIMKSHEILMENRKPIVVYSDLVRYNPVMPLYMREISIIPEYYVTIVHNGKKELVEIVPESFLGSRLQLSRRFFASTVFLHNKSSAFLKSVPYINNDEEYLYYRMLSYKRHLQEINNIIVMEDRPVKLFKRLMQTADMVYPAISEELYEEISDFVEVNLNNSDIKLINEYTNICGNLLNIMEYPSLFFELLHSGKLDIMYKTLELSVESMEHSANIDTKTVVKMKEYQEQELSKMFDIKNIKDLKSYREQTLVKYADVNEQASKAVFKLVKEPEKIEKYLGIFNNIYIDSGFHKVSLYWLNNDTLGIVEDNFTRNIKDFKKFAKENDLIDVNYKLIKDTDIPDMKMRYDIFARYDPSVSQNEYYKRFQKRLIDDRKNFVMKRKFVCCF